VIVTFVDISGIFYHHYLNFLFIILGILFRWKFISSHSCHLVWC